MEVSQEEKDYEERLRRRLTILQQQMQEGKVKIAEGLQVVESLKAVRVGPDGQIDLNTVDGNVRALSLAVAGMHERNELKKQISLSEIQNMYFQFFEINFMKFFKIMRERGITPHEAGLAAKNSEGTIREMVQFLKPLMDFIEEFWSNVGDIAHIHVEDMHNNIKGIFGGDLFPSHSENIASKCGIYTDTIVLPDPFLRTKAVFERATPANQAYFIMKHAMNILQYKELACADVEIPIVVILPDISELEEDEKKFYHQLGEIDTLKHSQKLFNRRFESMDELMDFASALDTIERAIAEIADKSRVLFDTAWEGDIAAQLARATQDKTAQMLGTDNPGVILALQSLGRLATSNELLIKSRRLQGIPLIDAPTSWQYLVWKMEYDADSAEKSTHTKNLHIVKALQSLADGEMQWLGNIPPKALIEMRKQSALEEIRSILGQGIDNLVASNPSNFYRTHDQIFDNFNQAFEKHHANIKELRAKQWKFAGSDIGSWLVTGTLGITAAATGTPIWAFAALAADQILDAPKLKDIPVSIKTMLEENRKVAKSPVGLLFNIKNKVS